MAPDLASGPTGARKARRSRAFLTANDRRAVDMVAVRIGRSGSDRPTADLTSGRTGTADPTSRQRVGGAEGPDGSQYLRRGGHRQRGRSRLELNVSSRTTAGASGKPTEHRTRVVPKARPLGGVAGHIQAGLEPT